MPDRRIAVTGLGVAAPTALGAEPFHQALLEGARAVDTIQAFDASRFPSGIGGEITALELIETDIPVGDTLLTAGQILVSTGFDLFDPKRMSQYGYGKLDNVVTSLEFERMLSSTGPSEGTVRLKNGQEPRTLDCIYLFIIVTFYAFSVSEQCDS